MQKEAAWAIANLVDGGWPKQVVFMIELGGLRGLLNYFLTLEGNEAVLEVVVRSE